MAEVHAFFDVPGALVAGWLHYLAFDLFVGAWISERVAALRWPHALTVVLLLLTCMLGPLGLLAHVALRGTLNVQPGARP